MSYALRSLANYEQCLQDCKTYKTCPDVYCAAKKVRASAEMFRKPKRKRTYMKHSGSKQACQLRISQISVAFRSKYSVTATKGVHKTSNGNYQVQIWNARREKLVHQGIFKDRDVAVLASAIARSEPASLEIEHYAREKIEKEYASFVRTIRGASETGV